MFWVVGSFVRAAEQDAAFNHGCIFGCVCSVAKLRGAGVCLTLLGSRVAVFLLEATMLDRHCLAGML